MLIKVTVSSALFIKVTLTFVESMNVGHLAKHYSPLTLTWNIWFKCADYVATIFYVCMVAIYSDNYRALRLP